MSIRRNRRPKPTTDTRSPDERLEAFAREKNVERAERTLIRIAEDLDAGADPCPWIAAARTLSERLVISGDAFYFLTDVFTESVFFNASQTDAELCRLRDAMKAIEREHGLRDDETWEPEDGPEEWQALAGSWERRATVIVAAFLRDAGHGDVADLLETNHAEYDRRVAKGRDDTWGEADAGE